MIQEWIFTIKRTEKFNSGTSPYMVIVQRLMISMTTQGGVAQGRITQQTVTLDDLNEYF